MALSKKPTVKDKYQDACEEADKVLAEALKNPKVEKNPKTKKNV